MSLPFRTLQEFLGVRDRGGLSFPEAEARIGETDLGKLVSVLSKTAWGRFAAVKRWLKEVGRLCGKKIRLKISFSPHKPYMTENGCVGLYYRDFFRQRYLFFAVAHETAHFLLMCDEDYCLLKALEEEYPADERDRAMCSPIEYCANRIMLMLFERCACVAETQAAREMIAWCRDRFQEQMKGMISSAEPQGGGDSV